MKSSVIDNGGQVVASTETEAKADAEASLDNTGSGNAPVPNEGVEDMKEKEPEAAQTQQRVEPERALIPLDSIEVDEKKYPRDHVDAEAVEEYAAYMKGGAVFPDIEVYGGSGEFYLLIDGRHRVEAGRALGLGSIWAQVFRGDARQATLRAVEANARHGVRRTHADKRKAVTILLQDQEWSKWNDSEIARHCNVSPELVKTVKAELGIVTSGQENDGACVQRIRRNGKEFEQKRKAAAKPLPAHIAAIGKMTAQAHTARAWMPENEPKLAKELDKIGSELHELMGKATGAKCRISDLPVPLNVYHHALKGGIRGTKEFAKKGLATHAANVGLGCGHQCSYCSSPSLRFRLPDYGEIGISAYDRGQAVIDPESAVRINGDKPRLTPKDTVMLCTCDDAWSPEARRHEVGRKCLRVLVEETAANVRILTKSAEVVKDLDVARDARDRVLVGLSTGIPASREDVAAAVEPNASPITARLQALKQAHDLGFKTYGMLCPCLPIVADTAEALTEMFKSVMDCGASEIWLEPVNARGQGLINTAEALRIAGLKAEAEAVDAISDRGTWSKYAADLAETAAKVAESLGVRERLHVLMYSNKLVAGDLGRIKALGGCVTLLGGDESGAEEPAADATAAAGNGGNNGEAAA